MTEIAKAHSDVVTIVEYGQTYEKRTISLLKASRILIVECVDVSRVFVRCGSQMNRIRLPDWDEYWGEKESYLDGLWHTRQGMDRPGLLSVLCQTGRQALKIQESSFTLKNKFYSKGKTS